MTHNSSCSALRFTSLCPHPCTFLQRFYQPLQIVTPYSSSDCPAMNWAMAILVSKIIRSHSPGRKRTGSTMMLVTEWGSLLHPACWGEPLRFLRAGWTLQESTSQHNANDQRPTLTAVPFLPSVCYIRNSSKNQSVCQGAEEKSAVTGHLTRNEIIPRAPTPCLSSQKQKVPAKVMSLVWCQRGAASDQLPISIPFN